MHEGHRMRLKDKFLLGGIDGFEDHEVLELLLFYAIPRKNTNEIAHKLLEKFGSLDAVFDSPINLLRTVDGVGDSAAIFIKIISNITRLYIERKYVSGKKALKFDEMNNKLMMKFIGRQEETVAVMLLDAKGKILYDGIVNKGTVNAVDLYMRRIIELVVLYNASAIILAHNHPSGVAVPSRDDIETTKAINNILKSMKVNLLDHIIVADGDYVSMRDCGMLEPPETDSNLENMKG